MGMVEDIIEDLAIELTESDPLFNQNLLSTKVKSAYRDVKNLRRYPDYYKEDVIEKDMLRFYGNVRDIALYDYNAVGAEFELSHSEDGVSRSYTDRDKLFCGVIPLSR